MSQPQLHAEWQRAHLALRAADLLFAAGLYADAVSRAYYATMHAAKAALLVHNVMPESHRAVRRLFGQMLIQTGELEKAWADILAEEYTQREVADYDAAEVFEATEAGELVRDAHRFIERITRYLTLKDVPLQPGEEDSSA